MIEYEPGKPRDLDAAAGLQADPPDLDGYVAVRLEHLMLVKGGETQWVLVIWALKDKVGYCKFFESVFEARPSVEDIRSEVSEIENAGCLIYPAWIDRGMQLRKWQWLWWDGCNAFEPYSDPVEGRNILAESGMPTEEADALILYEFG